VALASASALSGCFATEKHLQAVEQDITSKNTWTGERLQQLEARVDEVRAENEVLRSRLDALGDQISTLGEEIADRFTDFEKNNRTFGDQLQQAAKTSASSATQREKDREELLERFDILVNELTAENEKLKKRLEALENSAVSFGRSHKVKAGESIQSIARQYGVSAEAIIQANGISDANLIQVGEELLIPGVIR
jgi:LysM repeat protein